MHDNTLAASTATAPAVNHPLLEAVLSSATNAAVVYDAEHDEYLANAGALELHGMPPASVPYERWADYHDAYRADGTQLAAHELPLARAMRGERVPAMRLTFRPRVGAARAVDVRGEPLLDAEGRLLGAIAIFRDVESAESAAEALRLRSAVAANMAEGVTLVRAADGEIVYVNDAVERIFGYGPGELVGRHVSDLNACEATERAITQALRARGEWCGEVPNVRKDGRRIWCWANVSAFDHPEHGLVWIAVQTDVTERRRAAAALEHADERFRKVFEEGPVGIVMFGEDLTISDANEAFSRITGYTRPELIGRNLAEVTSEDVAGELERTAKLFSGELPRYRGERRCVTKAGETVWTSFTATVLRDHDGRTLYGLGIVEDINERKRIESLMVRQNERLSVDLESSLAELRLSRARILASADEERRRIERDLHDGAQQRLVALRVRLGLAQDVLREDPARAASLLDELGDDVDAALDEVRLLARGVYPSLLADRGLVEALRAAARNSPLSVTVESPMIGRFAEDIETAVYFACVEALQNAAKHAHRQTPVSLSLSTNGGLRFEVRDWGAGFSADGAGTGSGLSNMRDRIEAVGGRLEIQSVPGEGTCVSGLVPQR